MLYFHLLEGLFRISTFFLKRVILLQVTVGGKVVDHMVGFVPQEDIKETIEPAISQISE
ncbi:hypothetical protein [Peribacillus simplex]|uniref:hypothetical protein n=1 Tax=Peribacillus simplex TaxID=1478 RepID=UPI0025A0F479|nr:hypothetical protein [Peribacillus simplex]